MNKDLTLKKRLAEPGLFSMPKQRPRGKIITVNKHSREVQQELSEGQCWLKNKWLFCKLTINEFRLEIRWFLGIRAALAAFQGAIRDRKT